MITVVLTNWDDPPSTLPETKSGFTAENHRLEDDNDMSVWESLFSGANCCWFQGVYLLCFNFLQ